jgi:plastocyanin
MKRILIGLLAVFALSVASPAMADTSTVQITKAGFVPDKITVAQGDTVKWTNVDAATHQVVADDGTFASVALKTSDTYSFTFAKAGNFKYHDTYTKLKGEVVVTAPTPAPTVSLSPRRTSVIYGGSTVLTGSISNNQAGESVALMAQEAGQPKTTQAIQTTQTGASGSFMFTVNPTIRTAYEAQYKTASSDTVTVFVAPRITLGINRFRGIFSAHAISSRSYAGRFVLFQRLNPRTGTWYTIRPVMLHFGSVASFRARLPHGLSHVRIRMTAGQAGFGYIAGRSPTLLVRR